MNRTGWAILLVLLVLGLGFVILQAPGEALNEATAQAGPVRSDGAPPAVGPDGLLIPVAGIPATALIDSWHDPRAEGERQHEALDIPAAGGTPVVAAAAGRLEKIHMSAQGGLTAYIRIGRGDWMTYYAHLSGYAPGLHEGQVIARGETIGYVGDTGNAGPGNTHLHFGVSHMQPGERWWQGTPIDPFPLLAQGAAAR